MSYVATLVCNPAEPALDDRLLRRVAKSLPGAGASAWLAPGVAADIAFAGVRAEAAQLVEALRDLLRGLPVDAAIQSAAIRRKKLLVADMDSTMIGQECIDELAGEVGLRDRIAAITERAMRGEIAFEPALRERVALLAGLDCRVVERVLAARVTLTAGARALVGTMRAHGAHTVLVSGGFTCFTAPIAARIGFDEHRGNTLLVEGGRLSGRVAEPILGREAKRATLVELRARLGLARKETIAVGDGANDLAMLAEAGLGVAYRAKPAVAAAAHARIDHGDLTALLYLQGYRQEELLLA